MGRKKKPLLENVEITDIGAEGKAIARIEGKVVFVPLCIPGDIVDIQVTNARKSFYEGFVVNFKKYSEQRVNPFCGHFGVCGGCKWQQLPYKEQLKYKQKQVIDSFERIGKLSGYEVLPIIPSAETQFYRNKLEFTFSDNRWLTVEELNSGEIFNERNALGFHIPQRFDKILDLKNCYLQKEPSELIRKAIKEYAIKNNYSFFNLLKQEGFLRNLIIRITVKGEVMVIISFFYEDEHKRIKLLEHIQQEFPEITALFYVINSKKNEVLYDQEIIRYKGKDHIIETLDGLKFKIGPKSFYQTNSKQAENLYGVIKDFANLKGDETVYDLYTGTGTIALYLAGLCAKCIGVELIPEAIEDAKENATLNNILNTLFYSGDVKDLINTGFLELNGKPDVVVLDPPRSGIHPLVVETINKIRSQKIVYVSCNPATQARDIALMKEIYNLEKIKPVDMFPHTHHVENVALLTLKK